MTVTVRTLDREAVERRKGRLADILIDAVLNGAGVSFMWPMAKREAEAYWAGVALAVAEGRTVLFAAERDGEIAGTVQLCPAWQPNQPDIDRLLQRYSADRPEIHDVVAEIRSVLDAYPDRVFFEILNEPEFSDAYRWYGVEAKLAAAIRRAAPRHTIIATGARWDDDDDLIFLEPLPDPAAQQQRGEPAEARQSRLPEGEPIRDGGEVLLEGRDQDLVFHSQARGDFPRAVHHAGGHDGGGYL